MSRADPQRFTGTGNGYNCHFDAVLEKFPHKERCVDNTIFWDTSDNFELHWWRTINLETTSKAGIVLNSEKFQFSAKEVDFAGFRLR